MNTYGSTPLRIFLDSETRIAAIDAQLASDLGYDPRIGIDEGLVRTYEWYKQVRLLPDDRTNA